MVMTLSLFVAVMPFLGFPGAIKDVFYTSAGILILFLAYLMTYLPCERCDEGGVAISEPSEVVAESEDVPYDMELPAEDALEEVRQLKRKAKQKDV